VCQFHMSSIKSDSVSIAFGGDVMTGRGIDQILPHPGDPKLHEEYVRDALEYVGLAIHANGQISFPVEFDYIWGDALVELHRADMRIVNLETSITRSDGYWTNKGIHYRMHPDNIGCLTAARIDCCGLANNHMLDWGNDGLDETLRTLDAAHIAHPGAGRRSSEAAAPSVLDLPSNMGRVLVLALGLPTSGIFPSWAATASRQGVNYLNKLSLEAAGQIAQDLLRITRQDDITVVSIHWGGNWGYAVPPAEIAFAHRLVEDGIDVVLGHSSHHPKAVELYRDRLILYGCGDFLNDYEGISGYEEYRDDLALLYQVRVKREPRLHVEPTLVPFQLKRLRLNRASAGDARWLCEVLQRESARFNTEISLQPDLTMAVHAR
jgi:poly-gamma-glutamate capsule biosynthesis protein CapA/YwtB (metallophosphatase superfamily)